MTANKVSCVSRPDASPNFRFAGSQLELVGVLIFALLLRLLTYSGVFGSDDITYFDRALDVATGTWSSANYNGALRYGYNIPAGLFIWLLGGTPFVANLWPLLCSIGEIAVVYLLAALMFDRRAAVFASLLLATAPLHISVATRVHADPVVSLFITLSFALLWVGWARRNSAVLFACGMSIGAIFWTKELVGIVWLAFVPMLWMFRGRWHEVIVVLAGLLLMMVLHGLLMVWIAGDPLHLIKTVLGQVKTNFVQGMQGHDAPSYYLKFLFFDFRHVGLVAVFALLSLWFVPRELPHDGAYRRAWYYVLLWALGLFAILSVFPVSLSPLRFVMKQSNYITLFLGAFALLGGLALACMPKRLGKGMLVLAASLGILLSFFQQADYRAFTAGSMALGSWVVKHPGAVVFGSTNNASLGNFQAKQLSQDGVRGRIVSFRALAERPDEVSAIARAAPVVYAALDAQTSSWAAQGHGVSEPRPCWGQPMAYIAPANLGLGNKIAEGAAAVAGFLDNLGLPGMSAAHRSMQKLAQPPSVVLYRLDSWNPVCQE